ncbi:MAG: four helix bundle protein [Prevotella sp.]|nr:four helix bundle protein [Prevotella sp.]MDY4854370.1 four helix bundle protein [Prevotella sp.]
MKKCDGDNAIVLKSKQFAIRIIRLYQFLNNSKHEYIISKQLLRSGTSIGANVSEATCAFSKKDFLSKMYIAFKESAETLYWIELLHDTDYLNETQFQSIYNDCLSIKSLLSSITKSTAEAINS